MSWYKNQALDHTQILQYTTHEKMQSFIDLEHQLELFSPESARDRAAFRVPAR